MKPLHTYYRNATPYSWYEGMKFSHFSSLLLSLTEKWLWSESGQNSVKKLKYFRLRRNEYKTICFVYQINEFKDHYREVSEYLPRWLLVV